MLVLIRALSSMIREVQYVSSAAFAITKHTFLLGSLGYGDQRSREVACEIVTSNHQFDLEIGIAAKVSNAGPFFLEGKKQMKDGEGSTQPSPFQQFVNANKGSKLKSTYKPFIPWIEMFHLNSYCIIFLTNTHRS